MAFPSVHERLLAQVTGNPGTGAVTVGAAISGHQTFAAADDGNTFDVVIYSVDSNGKPNGSWEVQAQSTFTNASTSLARVAGNVVDGSSGPGVLVNFSAGTQRVANVLCTEGVQIVRKTGGTAGTDDAQLSMTASGLQIFGVGTKPIILGNVTNGALFSTQSSISSCPFADNVGNIQVSNSKGYNWFDGTAITRQATGVYGSTKAGGNWLFNGPGEGNLAAAFTNATATMAVTNLSFTLLAGRSYRITLVLQASNSTAGEGIQFDFNGGSATATTFFASATINGTAVAGTLTSTTLAGAINWTSITGTDYITVQGFIKVNAGGTLILRAAENTHATGTLTIGAGSWMSCVDTGAL